MMIFESSLKKHIFNAVLAIAVVNLIVVVLLYFVLVSFEKENIYKSNINLAKLEFQKTKSFINEKVDHYKFILDIIEKSDSLKLLQLKNIKDPLQKDFSFILNNHKNIFQIRYLDSSGLEKLGLKRNRKGNTVSWQNLQDKNKRYYFTKASSLKKGEYYISNLDLNIEAQKIEKPFIPTIRIAKPVFKNDQFDGIIVINYDAKEILEHLVNKNKFNVYFMDKRYNFLIHPDKRESFSSQLKTNYSVKKEIPNIDSIIKNGIDENRKYFLQKITVTDDDFYIIYSIKDIFYNNEIDKIKQNLIYLFVLVLLICFPFLIFGSYLQSFQANLLEHIIDNIPHPVFFKNSDEKFEMVNKAFIRLYNIDSKKKVFGKTPDELFEKDLAVHCKIRDKKALEKGFLKVEEEITLNGNEKHIFDIRVVRIASFGVFYKKYILGIAIDITEIKSLNEQLEKIVKKGIDEKIELEKSLVEQSKMAEIGNMLSTILHQWKQPLNIITLTSSSISFDLEDRTKEVDIDKVISSFDTITEQANFMSETSNDFQSFFSPNKKNEPFSIHKAINKIEKILSHKINTLNVKIINDKGPDHRINGYDNEFAQVILNILNNALDAFKRSNIQDRKILINIYQKQDKLIIKIKDNAGGIADELLPEKIFEHFFTTKGDGGTGIGLAISRRIIQDSFKGKLEAYNEDNGAVFKIVLNKERY